MWRWNRQRHTAAHDPRHSTPSELANSVTAIDAHLAPVDQQERNLPPIEEASTIDASTQQQEEAGTDADAPTECETCPICHDEVEMNVLASTACKHHYHRECLNRWKDVSRRQFRAFRCPVCRLPLTDDFDVDDEPESEASFFTPTPMLVQYYAGERTGLGYVATFPPETWMSSEWRLVPRPYSAYPINRGGSTRGDRGSRNIMERLGEFGSSLLHGVFGPTDVFGPTAHPQQQFYDEYDFTLHA